MSEARLLLELVGDERAPVELPRSGVLTLGNSRERADLWLEGQGVADVHCAIGRLKGGGWALKDLGSEFGTFVNGERVQSVRLEAGHQILIGSRRLRVVDAAAPPEPAAAQPPPPASQPAAAPVDAASTPAAPASPPATPAAAPAPQASRSPSGAPTIAGYRIEKALGRGGMGEVFLAQQESLHRKVALKLLSSKLQADADFVGRFLAEARAAAALNHPNVVTVHDVGEHAGRHYLSMEFMERGNLESRLGREGRLSNKEAIEVLSDASKGLVYAEMRGIVHRDIKPANLMQDEVGTTKLADLGLATHLEAEATESDNKKIFGTPHFISPEQARGERVDCRSDLYSLGATMYRLLSGHTPFEGSSTRDILRGHFFEEPTPLSEVAPEVEPELARIVHRLLQKKPDERYPSAGVLLQEVERLRSRAVHGVDAPPLVVTRRSRRGPVTVVALALLGLVAFLAYRSLTGSDGGEKIAGNGGTGQGGPRTDVPAGPPRLPDVTPVDAGATTPPKDDDTELKLRETEAENAYLRLPKDMSDEDRRAELLLLVDQFAGTTKATEFEREAVNLERKILEARSHERETNREASAAVARLQQALAPGGVPLPLAEGLEAMLSVPLDPGLLAEPTFMSQWRALFRGRISAEVEQLRTRLNEVDRLAQQGDFDAVETQLEPFGVAPVLPPLPAGLGLDEVPELGDLQGLHSLLSKRHRGLAAERAAHVVRLANEDAEALAGGFGGALGLEAELRKLDFAAAEQRLATLSAGLHTESARAFVDTLRADLTSGREALEKLAAEFAKDGWRRKSIDDPRTSRRSRQEAVGASARGVQLDMGGQAELVPWSAFGGSTESIHQLFYQRLQRSYTARELEGIEALMRLGAVTQAVAEAGEMLVEDLGRLTAEETAAMIAGFETGRPWAQEAGRTARLDREARAVALLAEALAAAGEGSWSIAVAGLERLLAEYRDTLLVALLSDGRAWMREEPVIEEPPTPDPVPPSNGAGEGDSDSGDDGSDDSSTSTKEDDAGSSDDRR